MELSERFFPTIREYNDYVKHYATHGKLITPVSVVPLAGGFRIFYMTTITK